MQKQFTFRVCLSLSFAASWSLPRSYSFTPAISIRENIFFLYISACMRNVFNGVANYVDDGKNVFYTIQQYTCCLFLDRQRVAR